MILSSFSIITPFSQPTIIPLLIIFSHQPTNPYILQLTLYPPTPTHVHQSPPPQKQKSQGVKKTSRPHLQGNLVQHHILVHQAVVVTKEKQWL